MFCQIGGGGVATHLFTNPAPGKLTYMMKKPNGKVVMQYFFSQVLSIYAY